MRLQIIARVEVSPLPVHTYVVNPTREVWIHSDTDGTFDVISIANVAAGNLTATKVPVRLAWLLKHQLQVCTCFEFIS